MHTAGELLGRYTTPPALLSVAFATAWGDVRLNVAREGRAAALLHLELVSRVTTQELLYTHGTEGAALKSLHSLFGRTREICASNLEAHLFHAVAWHVLNTHVRPFTSRWHRRWETGGLHALDDADDFRLELAALVRMLRSFLLLLQEMNGQVARDVDATDRSAVAEEMVKPLPWGLDKTLAGSTHTDRTDELRIRHGAESKAIESRRKRVGESPKPERAVGLALSGGGIRSATFSLGVLDALARRDLLPQFDYLSAVSGGGYVGGFLTNLLDGGEADHDPAAEKGSAAIRARIREPFARGDRESLAIGHVRQNCRYLASGPVRERWMVVVAQVAGLMTNLMALSALLCILSLALIAAEDAVDTVFGVGAVLGSTWSLLATCVALAAFGLCALPAVAAFSGTRKAAPEILMLVFAAPLLGLGAYVAYQAAYTAFADNVGTEWSAILASLGLPFMMILAGISLERFLPKVAFFGRWISQVAAPAFLVVAMMTFSRVLTDHPSWHANVLGGALVIAGYLWFLMNLNFTGLHRHYRRRLAHAFLVNRKGVVTPSRRLSAICHEGAAPYLILNAALNVPASKQPQMRGRLTDFFSFTPDYCGSPITGYWATSEIEELNPAVDLAAAMAISGAAVSPQMGLQSRAGLGFWLSLLNVRLGYWLRRSSRVVGGRRSNSGAAPDAYGPAAGENTAEAVPAKKRRSPWRPPALPYLLRELAGCIDERSEFLSLSDGGHMENLGVYELLRRRCKYIVAVDGEQDTAMTFHAVANLQRLAAIDLGIRIDLDLEDLRLDKDGMSRSHFHFCRVHYPGGGIGYLVYLKLSLTGNEGEFVRRFRLDEPAFPHHPTSDQNFTEARFEAYRSLGEHVGDKLFLESIVGPMARDTEIDVDAWFAALGRSFLEPLNPSQTRSSNGMVGNTAHC
ncbi:patatin-like phospholipase family protein [Sphingomonas aurantiaca]|uniref:patatin-like phospholipase family protein n=1 Tax=Sphingomonas aurantiaca TaxID=185949 RepID=UPI00334D2136